jgi:DNA-binding response OmpR family regulator
MATKVVIVAHYEHSKVRQMIRHLECHGYIVVIIQNWDVYRQVRNFDPDIVIIDHTIMHDAAVRLIKKLRADVATLTIPIIAISNPNLANIACIVNPATCRETRLFIEQVLSSHNR